VVFQIVIGAVHVLHVCNGAFQIVIGTVQVLHVCNGAFQIVIGAVQVLHVCNGALLLVLCMFFMFAMVILAPVLSSNNLHLTLVPCLVFSISSSLVHA